MVDGNSSLKVGERIFFNYSYEEKEIPKSLGAKYDFATKRWYCTAEMVDELPEEVQQRIISAGKEGHQIQTMVWKDGGLTEAIRRAKQEKTILIIDELLRIPNRELNILLSALTPLRGEYHLRTGRMVKAENGIGAEETLSCPVENLFVIATTNVGGQFSVDAVDPALAERFVVIRKDTTNKDLTEILGKKIADKGFSKEALEHIIKFYDIMQNALIQELVEYTPTLRTLARSIELADEEKDIAIFLYKQSLLWVRRNIQGKIVMEEQEFIEQALRSSFNVVL